MTTAVLRLCWVLLVVVGHALWCARAVASSARPEVVVVASAEYGPTVTQLFQAVVHARLPEVDVRHVSETKWQSEPTATGAADLICILDTSQASEWRLRLEYRGRAWTRTIEGGLSRDAAAVEAAALMAAHTSVALLTQDTTAAAPSQPPELEAWAPAALEAPTIADAPRSPPTNAPVPASASGVPERSDFWWLAFGGAYRGQTYAADYPWTHGAKLSLFAELPAAPCAALSATLVDRTRVTSEFGSFELGRQQGELLLGWCFHWDRWGLSPRGGALVEATHRSQTSSAAGVGSSTDQRQLAWAGVTAIEGRWAFVERVHLVLGLGATYFLQKQEFVAAGVPEPILAPYRVRFAVDLGLDVGLF